MRHNPTKYDDPQALFLEAGLKSGLLTIQEPKATDNIVSTGTARKAQAPNQTVGGTVGLNPIFTNFNPPMGPVAGAIGGGIAPWIGTTIGFGGANLWNPLGWVALGLWTVGVAALCIQSDNSANFIPREVA